ncbi:MAG: NADH-quinone oxidoreductase subunit M, partial [Beijerinckiaceae bacterium]
FFATTGVILSACYALWLFARVVFGEIKRPVFETIPDLDRREMAMLAPLVVLTIYYGVQPGPILDASAASIDQMLKTYNAAIAAASKTAMLAQ